MRTLAWLACVASCGSTPREVVTSTPLAPVAQSSDAPRPPDPDLDRPPPRKLLAIDWATADVGSDAGARALWQQIAPTGIDWEERLFEVPSGPIAKALATALLREGNFTCNKPTSAPACAKVPPDVPDPRDDATLADPCLRRLLAMWSIDQLDPADIAGALRPVLTPIVTMPPPESQLVFAVLQKDSDNPDQNARLQLLALAWQAGQRELVHSAIGPLDEAHLTEAVQKHHIDGALEILSAEGQRAVYVAAVGDTHLAAATRVQAIADLSAAADDKLPPDLRATLIAASKTPDCAVAAAAVHALVVHREHGAEPVRSGPATMRALCVVASYEQLQRADETSPLASYVPPHGLELVKVSYDPYSTVDTDGDGNPHTEHTTDLLSRDALVFPETDDLVRAFAHCKGTTCSSDDHDFRFTFRGGLFARLEIDERPPCSP